jgi:hypothetical protein
MQYTPSGNRGRATLLSTEGGASRAVLGRAYYHLGLLIGNPSNLIVGQLGDLSTLCMSATHSIQCIDLGFTVVDQLVRARHTARWGGGSLAKGLLVDFIVRSIRREVRRQGLVISYAVGLLAVSQVYQRESRSGCIEKALVCS